MRSRFLIICILILLAPYYGMAQDRVEPVDTSAQAASVVVDKSSPVPVGDTPAPSNYILGPDDQITLTVSDIDELSNKPMRIDMKGNIHLPMAGRVHAAGLTAEQLQSQIEDRLKKFVNDPDVVVSVSEYRSQPVSVLGAVNTPGVHQLEGHKTLFEVLSSAGGVRSDAGNTVTITRELKWGPIPLADAKTDSTGKYSIATVKVKEISDGKNPTENIVIEPDDVISVSKAEVVYCIGSVHRPGGFVLGESESLSALQVLALAEGFDAKAAGDRAKVLREVPGTLQRTEIAVNLKQLMAGKGSDLPLRANDILFVPNSAAKSAAGRTAEAAIQIMTGLAIYAR
jgi:polysaccharide biosynthesis/export protein